MSTKINLDFLQFFKVLTQVNLPFSSLLFPPIVKFYNAILTNNKIVHIVFNRPTKVTELCPPIDA